MDWSVTFNKEGQPGKKIHIDRHFFWNGCDFWIPAVYVCEEGLVMDTCLEADRETMAAFLNKWRYLFEKERLGQEPNLLELRQFQQENPLERDYQMTLEYNGAALEYEGGSGRRWIPPELQPIFVNDLEMPAFLEQYGLSRERVWQFRRDRFRWGSVENRDLQSLVLSLVQRPKEHYSVTFLPTKEGEQFQIPNPLDGSDCLLTVKSITQEKAPCPKSEGLLFPEYCVIMEYALEPELPWDVFFLADTENSDQPKRIGKTDQLGGAIGLIVQDRQRPKARYGVSSVHFEPVDTVTWQAGFRAKTVEDLSVSLI